MGAKIHLYPVERFTFGDDDYYDIDYFDGLIYQTAKIKGSTIKQGILNTVFEYQPPQLNILSGHLSGGVNINTNTAQGFHLHINGTGTPAQLDYNIPLKNNGIDYDGSTLKINLAFSMYNTNSGGNVRFEITAKYVNSNGTENAEDATGNITITTDINVTGRTVNFLYEDEIANFNGPANSKFLMLRIKRITTGGFNNNLINGIGLKITK